MLIHMPKRHAFHFRAWPCIHLERPPRKQPRQRRNVTRYASRRHQRTHGLLVTPHSLGSWSTGRPAVLEPPTLATNFPCIRGCIGAKDEMQITT